MGREAVKPQQQQGQAAGYTVEQLVAFNRYNPDILPDLENYVNDQVSSQIPLLFLGLRISIPIPQLFTILFSIIIRFHHKLIASNQISAFFASTRYHSTHRFFLFHFLIFFSLIVIFR